jgi:hypothetical protein
VKIARILGTVAVATVAAVGAAAPAFATTSEVPQNVAAVQTRVGAKAQHIGTKMQTLQSRLTSRPHLTAVRSTLQADINKVLADTVAWRQQVAAATTMAGIRAADPAHRAVIADLAKLHTDLAAAKATKNTTKPATTAPNQTKPATTPANQTKPANNAAAQPTQGNQANNAAAQANQANQAKPANNAANQPNQANTTGNTANTTGNTANNAGNTAGMTDAGN